MVSVGINLQCDRKQARMFHNNAPALVVGVFVIIFINKQTKVWAMCFRMIVTLLAAVSAFCGLGSILGSCWLSTPCLTWLGSVFVLYINPNRLFVVG